MCGCSKSSNTGDGSPSQNNLPDRTSPVITILTPSNNQIFSAGQIIQVSASAMDNVKVTELHIHVLNKTTGILLRDIHSYPDAPSGGVQDSFPAQAGLVYLVQIIANDPRKTLRNLK